MNVVTFVYSILTDSTYQRVLPTVDYMNANKLNYTKLNRSFYIAHCKIIYLLVMIQYHYKRVFIIMLLTKVIFRRLCTQGTH